MKGMFAAARGLDKHARRHGGAACAYDLSFALVGCTPTPRFQVLRIRRFNMAQEPIVLATADGTAEPAASQPGVAEVLRYSDVGRITMGTLYIVAGFLGATMCIVVPVAHLITTWALPLVGILMGLRTYKRRVVLYAPEGVCPVCGEAIQFSPGGSIDDPSWQTCPKCKAALRVRPATGVGAIEGLSVPKGSQPSRATLNGEASATPAAATTSEATQR
jgi:hypothetical protein